MITQEYNPDEYEYLRRMKRMEDNPLVEEASYLVTARLSVRIDFSPIERESLITKHDAIENAMGTVPEELWAALEDEGWTIEFEAERSM